MAKEKYYLGVADQYERYDISYNDILNTFGSLDKPVSSSKELADNLKEENLINFTKFLKDPLMALMDAAGCKHEEYYSESKRNEFLNNVIYDPETKIYIYNRFSTSRGWNPLKEEHWKRFKDNDFIVNYIRTEIQILSTEVETVPEESMVPYSPMKTFKDFLK